VIQPGGFYGTILKCLTLVWKTMGSTRHEWWF